ncbi:MAG: EamA family transporter [Clostridia bacterium]|nr:EamA family transporter [Clostridia bacterium]
MTWFIFSLVALLCWSGSDFFSKHGTKQNDKNSHWKVVFAVGLIMGIHFVITLIGGAIIDDPESVPKFVASLFYTDFKLIDFVRYLPVAGLYILAMVLGYVGLRYIELSISSPICNSSGALAFLLCLIVGLTSAEDVTVTAVIGVVMITLGVVGLGFVESREDEETRLARQEKANRKYAKSFLALLLPIAYLIIDALGTVGDELIFAIEDDAGNGIITDYAANSAFELTFFLLAIFAFVYLKFVKKDTVFKGNRSFMLGGLCETVGQVFYMAVMFSDFTVGMVIISAYCALSVLWSRIFLKEKLSWKHYVAIAVAFAGIMVLGVAEELL